MNDPAAICTVLIILATVACSWMAFNNRELADRWMFHPESILAWKEYWRLITSALVHVSWFHLGCNMISLYIFGRTLEINLGPAQFLLIYVGSILGGVLLSLYIHRHHDYRSVGASGGVCGIIFAFIVMFPEARLLLFPLPFYVPGWIWAIAFMVGSFYAIRKQMDNVGHDAHLGGAIIGLLIAAALHPERVFQTNLYLFLTVLGISLAMFFYLLRNPLLLPLASAFQFRRPQFRRSSGRGSPHLPIYKQEARQLDAVLEKIATSGIDSLSPDEKALLERTSGKYKRRAQSKKPESGLSI